MSSLDIESLLPGEVQKLANWKTSQKSITAFVQVVEVKRSFLTDHKRVYDVYDIYLSDLNHKIKCFLNFDLKSVVKKKHLKGSIVKVTVIPNQLKYPVVIRLGIIRSNFRNEPVKEVPYIGNPDDKTIVMLDDRPYFGSLKTYLHNQSIHIPIGTQWKEKDISLNLNEPVDMFLELNNEFKLIKELCDEFEALKKLPDSQKNQRTYENPKTMPFIVGRVLRKTTLKNYGDIPSQAHSIPFTFSIVLGDISGDIKVTFWERASLIYPSIRVGDLLRIQGFRVRRHFDKRYKLCDSPIELAINPGGTSRVRQLTGKLTETEELKNLRYSKVVLTPSDVILRHPGRRVGIKAFACQKRPRYNSIGIIYKIGKLKKCWDGYYDQVYQTIWILDYISSDEVVFKFRYDGYTNLNIGDQILILDVHAVSRMNIIVLYSTLTTQVSVLSRFSLEYIESIRNATSSVTNGDGYDTEEFDNCFSDEDIDTILQDERDEWQDVEDHLLDENEESVTRKRKREEREDMKHVIGDQSTHSNNTSNAIHNKLEIHPTVNN